jgi:hypothetical protein
MNEKDTKKAILEAALSAEIALEAEQERHRQTKQKNRILGQHLDKMIKRLDKAVQNYDKAAGLLVRMDDLARHGNFDEVEKKSLYDAISKFTKEYQKDLLKCGSCFIYRNTTEIVPDKKGMCSYCGGDDWIPRDYQKPDV